MGVMPKAKSITELQAMLDADLDKRLAGLLGVDIPTEEESMIAVAWSKISCTGPVFELRNGRSIMVPPGEALPPTADGNWNNRYAVYIAKRLGDEIAEEIKAYRKPPQSYCSESSPRSLLNAVEAEIARQGLVRRYMETLEDASKAMESPIGFFSWTLATAPVRARVIAAIVALSGGKQGNG